jgi:aryl-alcohol dehydrogenase-like predicted oxidoreductase
MRYRSLGTPEIEVSEVGFGVWTLAAGWWGDHSDAAAVEMLRAAADLGVTFFDTADTYGRGRGETLLRDAFPGSERDRIVIGAKFGYDWQSRAPSDAGHREAPHRFDVPFLEAALDASLERLGTDHIDHYQMHNPRMAHLLQDDVWTWLERERRAGRVRSVGVALGPAIGWEEEGRYALEHLPVDAVQMIYNALELDPGRALIEVAERAGKSLLVRVPHSSGLLEGRYTEDTEFPPNDHRRHRPRSWLTEGLQKIEQLRPIERENGCTLGQVALRYVLRSPSVVSALPNIYDRAQLEEFVAASDAPDITGTQAAHIERLFESNYGLASATAEVAS